MALAVAVGRGAAGRATLVAGGWRGADPGQARALGGALLRLFGLRFAVFFPAQDCRHVVQGKDLCGGQKHTHSEPSPKLLRLIRDTVAPKAFWAFRLTPSALDLTIYTFIRETDSVTQRERYV